MQDDYYQKKEREISMDNMALQRLVSSINQITDIRLECFKTDPDIHRIREKAVLLDVNLGIIIDEVYLALMDATNYPLGDKRREEGRFAIMAAMQKCFDSLSGPERVLLLERARQTLPPRSHNDANAVLIAALELLYAGQKGNS